MASVLAGAVILLGRTNMFRFNNPVEAAKMKKELKKVSSEISVRSRQLYYPGYFNSFEDLQNHSHI